MGTKISIATAVVTPAPTDEYATAQGGQSKRTTREQMHTLEVGEHFVLPQVSEAATPTLAFGDGDTGLYESADDILNFAFAGISRWALSNSNFSSASTFGARLNRTPASSTSPAFSFVGDLDTGIGRFGADAISFICGGLESGRFEDSADLAATETSLWLFDFDNGTMEQVTVGAADSGGAGFKVLRIPN